MNTKLTLRLEEKLIRRAKAHARKTGKSVSRIVADYFSHLGSWRGTRKDELTPTVETLKGALRGARSDRVDYRRHLEDKYL